MSIVDITEIVGIIAFAFSGFMVAADDRLDLLGILIASFLTALGGGIIRDTISDKTPYSFTTLLPVLLVLSVIVFSIIFKLYKKNHLMSNRYFIISDSIGLVSFSISGALVALTTDFNIFGVVFLSFTTAVGGGLLRDMLLNKVPVILVSELYGTIAVFIGIVIWFLDYLKLISEISIILLFVLFLIIRLLAFHKKWHLPKLGSKVI